MAAINESVEDVTKTVMNSGNVIGSINCPYNNKHPNTK
jgi:hypothetical protein